MFVSFLKFSFFLTFVFVFYLPEYLLKISIPFTSKFLKTPIMMFMVCYKAFDRLLFFVILIQVFFNVIRSV